MSVTREQLSSLRAALEATDLSPKIKEEINRRFGAIYSTPSGVPGSGDGTTLTPGSGNQWQEIVADLEEAIGFGDAEYARCAIILKGVAAAAKSGDDLGAAEGIENYLKCVSDVKALRKGKPTQ